MKSDENSWEGKEDKYSTNGIEVSEKEKKEEWK